MEREGVGGLLGIAVIVAAIWIVVGGGWTTIKGWLGQDTYEDERAALTSFVKDRRVGSSGDVWLVKQSFGVDDRVALFFGYMDDWDACYEFLTSHKVMFDADTYTCQFAN